MINEGAHHEEEEFSPHRDLRRFLSDEAYDLALSLPSGNAVRLPVLA